ncbi:DUF4358 domain-containing protein [Cohnella soli]|uniref:DUF4358 domain-containing protein n=1 Tax=Cohnella soli TaxID=425005 RepID=A0ABW0HV69_9BACL
MKKRALIVILTTMILGSALSACSGNNNGGSTPGASPSSSASASPSGSPSASPSEEASESPSASPSESPSASPSETPTPSPKPSKDPEPSKEPTPTKKPEPSKKPTPTPKPTEKPKPKPTPSPSPSPAVGPASSDIVDAMLKAVEQPHLNEMSADQIKESYGIDTSTLASFSVRAPLINIKTNEIAVFEVKNAKSIDAIKKGIVKRAEDVQKMFEHYLPDQYENAKNYKIVVKGNYVLFIISESAADLEKAFTTAFDKK